MILYNQLAEYYFDLEKKSRIFEDEIGFLHHLFQEKKTKSILDLGCGSGEHVHELNKLGYQAKGIDLSTKMVELARKRFESKHYQLGNIQSFHSLKKFDSIICLFGTFNYLLSKNEIVKSIKQISENLNSSGHVVLEIWHANPYLKIRRKPISQNTKISKNGKILERKRGFRLIKEKLEILVEVNYLYTFNQKDFNDKHIMRVFLISEIINLLSENNFEIIYLFGNYSKKKFHENSGRMILVLKKR